MILGALLLLKNINILDDAAQEWIAKILSN